MRRVGSALLGAAVALTVSAGPAFGASGTEPAGGAEAGEAIGATIGALAATAVVVLIIAGYRSGRLALLGRAARLSERASGLPGWAALPSAVLGASLLTAVLGMYWDISLHIDNGRDAGPLANPAHYLILIGLYGVLLAGVLSIALCTEDACRSAIRLGPGWYAPIGAIVITACGAFALSGFPLDDLWHRLFGQDVTLWGPTHLMLIGGGSLAVLGVMVLMAEGVNAAGRDPDGGGLGVASLLFRFRRALMVGGFLAALSTFQGEFDFGVPQFRMVLHPVLILLAAGVGLVAIRTSVGRGGALLAVLGFVVVRGFLALMVGGVFGETTPHFPLYLVEALVVEGVFLSGSAHRRPILGGMLAGAGIGTVGLAAEWGWSHVWMPIPWSAGLVPEALLAGFATAVAAGAVGAFVGVSLARPRPEALGPRPRALARWERRTALAGALALMAIVAVFVPMTDAGPQRAMFALADAGGRAVEGRIRIDPPPPADVELLNITSWQGGTRLELDPLDRLGPGLYRTTEPIPVHGSWKSMLRVQSGDGLVSVPLYLPRDQAIPAPEVPVALTGTRAFVLDHENLQRERKAGVAGWITATAYLTVLAIALGFGALLAWALMRLGRADEGRPPRAERKVRGKDPSFA